MTILGVVAVAKAQVEPEATSPLKLGISGTLSYSARYMQMADFYAGGTSQMANLSGDLDIREPANGIPLHLPSAPVIVGPLPARLQQADLT